MSLIKLPYPSGYLSPPPHGLLTLQLKMAKRTPQLHNLEYFYSLYSNVDGKSIVILKSMHMSNGSLSQLTGSCKIKANILSFASITTLTDVEGRQNKGTKHMEKLGSWSLEKWQICGNKFTLEHASIHYWCNNSSQGFRLGRCMKSDSSVLTKMKKITFDIAAYEHANRSKYRSKNYTERI